MAKKRPQNPPNIVTIGRVGYLVTDKKEVAGMAGVSPSTFYRNVEEDGYFENGETKVYTKPIVVKSNRNKIG